MPLANWWGLLLIIALTALLQQLRENRKDTKTGPTWLKRKMRQLLGSYSESNYEVSRLLPTIDTAIDRAVALDVNPTDRWPQDIGTRVYLLVRSIMGTNL